MPYIKFSAQFTLRVHVLVEFISFHKATDDQDYRDNSLGPAQNGY